MKRLFWIILLIEMGAIFSCSKSQQDRSSSEDRNLNSENASSAVESCVPNPITGTNLDFLLSTCKDPVPRPNEEAAPLPGFLTANTGRIKSTLKGTVLTFVVPKDSIADEYRTPNYAIGIYAIDKHGMTDSVETLDVTKRAITPLGNDETFTVSTDLGATLPNVSLVLQKKPDAIRHIRIYSGPSERVPSLFFAAPSYNSMQPFSAPFTYPGSTSGSGQSQTFSLKEKLCFNDSTSVDGIRCANLDGSGMTTILKTSRAGGTTAMDVDFAHKRVAWVVNDGRCMIVSASLVEGAGDYKLVKDFGRVGKLALQSKLCPSSISYGANGDLYYAMNEVVASQPAAGKIFAIDSGSGESSLYQSSVDGGSISLLDFHSGTLYWTEGSKVFARSSSSSMPSTVCQTNHWVITALSVDHTTGRVMLVEGDGNGRNVGNCSGGNLNVQLSFSSWEQPYSVRSDDANSIVYVVLTSSNGMIFERYNQTTGNALDINNKTTLNLGTAPALYPGGPHKTLLDPSEERLYVAASSGVASMKYKLTGTDNEKLTDFRGFGNAPINQLDYFTTGGYFIGAVPCEIFKLNIGDPNFTRIAIDSAPTRHCMYNFLSINQSSGQIFFKNYFPPESLDTYYRTELNGSSRSPVISAISIIWRNEVNGEIYGYDSYGSGVAFRKNAAMNSLSFSFTPEPILDMAFDYTNQKLLIHTNNSIYRAAMDGSGPELLADLGTSSFEHMIAVDNEHHRVYWTLSKPDGSVHTFRADLPGFNNIQDLGDIGMQSSTRMVFFQ